MALRGLYGSQNELSINRAGFVMDDLRFAEIHYKDSTRFPDGFNFYNVNNGDRVAAEIALPNDCMECHKRDGAYDGVFVQFYPPLHEFLPAAVRARLSEPTAVQAHWAAHGWPWLKTRTIAPSNADSVRPRPCVTRFRASST